MPIYEYSCCHCNKDFEEIVRSSRERIKCPECASEQVERKLSVFSSPASHAESTPVGGGCGGCTPGGCGCH